MPSPPPPPAAFHPLLPPAVALILGIALAAWLAPPARPLLALGGACLLAGLWWGARRGRLNPWVLALACLLLGGGLQAREAAAPLPADSLAAYADHAEHALVARAASPPEPVAHGRRLLLEVEEADGRPARGRLQLGLSEEVAPPPPGRRVALTVRLRPFVDFANPGGFAYGRFMAEQGVRARAWLGQEAAWRDLGPAPDGVAARVLAARVALNQAFDRLPPGQARELLKSLVLGLRGGLSPATRDAFALTGTAHILAISGMNLALVWGAAFLLLRLAWAACPRLALRVPAPKPAALLAFLPCLVYALLAGATTPTLRALVTGLCLAAAWLLDRPYRPVGGLALAALVIGLIWPSAPLTVSFQLSFLAVAALLLVLAPLRVRLARAAGGSPGRRLAAWLGAWLGLNALVGLMVLPISLQVFHQLPLLFLPANALLAPLLGSLALPLTLSGALLVPVWPAAGEALWSLALIPADWSLAIARQLAAIEGGSLFLPPPGPWALGLAYAGALALLALRGPWRGRLGGAGLALALGLYLVVWLPARGDGKLAAWVLDVGQGLAVVARLPGGEVMVVDGGGLPGEGLDTGRQVVAPFLWSQGITRLARLALSHPDLDHSGGLPFLARWFAPGAIWHNGDPPDQGAQGRLLALAARRGIPLAGPDELPGEVSLSGARVLRLWPPAEAARRPRTSNDRSLWLGLNLGEAWLWLPGDAGPRVERLLVPALPSGGAQVIVAPHHGGAGALSPEVLARSRPRAVVVSAGCGNRFGLPRADTLSRARRSGAAVYATARQGAIFLESAGGEWRIAPYLTPPRPCPEAE